MPKTHKMYLLVVQQEKISITCALVIKADVTEGIFHPGNQEGTHEAFINELRSGVAAWVRQTDEGRQTYEYAGTAMNFGDLAGIPMEPILKHCPNIKSLEFIDVEHGALSYDTSVCNEVEEDET